MVSKGWIPSRPLTHRILMEMQMPPGGIYISTIIEAPILDQDPIGNL